MAKKPRGKNGGRRPGAGRPKGAKNKKTRLQRVAESEAKGILINSILENWNELIATKMDLALGNYKYTDADGKRVFEGKPDNRAIDDLLVFVVGKPDQLLKLEGSIDTPDIKDGIQALGDNIKNILEMKEKTIKPDKPKPKKPEKKPEPKPQQQVQSLVDTPDPKQALES